MSAKPKGLDQDTLNSWLPTSCA